MNEVKERRQVERRSSERGFGLVEVLLGSLLLAVTVLGTMGVLMTSRLGIKAAETETIATGLAQEVLSQATAEGAWRLLDAAGTDESTSIEWKRIRSPSGVIETEAKGEEAGGHWELHDKWRQMFLDADLPFGGAGHVSVMTIRVEGATDHAFEDAELVRLEVSIEWANRGVRNRIVHLETFLANVT